MDANVKHTLMLGITVTGLVAYFPLDHGEVFVNGVFKSTILYSA